MYSFDELSNRWPMEKSIRNLWWKLGEVDNVVILGEAGGRGYIELLPLVVVWAQLVSALRQNLPHVEMPFGWRQAQCTGTPMTPWSAQIALTSALRTPMVLMLTRTLLSTFSIKLKWKLLSFSLTPLSSAVAFLVSFQCEISSYIQISWIAFWNIVKSYSLSNINNRGNI